MFTRHAPRVKSRTPSTRLSAMPISILVMAHSDPRRNVQVRASVVGSRCAVVRSCSIGWSARLRLEHAARDGAEWKRGFALERFACSELVLKESGRPRHCLNPCIGSLSNGEVPTAGKHLATRQSRPTVSTMPSFVNAARWGAVPAWPLRSLQFFCTRTAISQLRAAR
jgi:hypothetical protein